MFCLAFQITGLWNEHMQLDMAGKEVTAYLWDQSYLWDYTLGSVLPVWLHFGIWDQSYLWDYIRREYTSGRRAWGSGCPYTSHSEVRPCCPCSRCNDLPFLLSGRGPHRNNNGQPCCYIHSLSKWLNVSFFIWNLIYIYEKKTYIWTSIFHWHNILPSSTWSLNSKNCSDFFFPIFISISHVCL